MTVNVKSNACEEHVPRFLAPASLAVSVSRKEEPVSLVIWFQAKVYEDVA